MLERRRPSYGVERLFPKPPKPVVVNVEGRGEITLVSSERILEIRQEIAKQMAEPVKPQSPTSPASPTPSSPDSLQPYREPIGVNTQKQKDIQEADEFLHKAAINMGDFLAKPIGNIIMNFLNLTWPLGEFRDALVNRIKNRTQRALTRFKKNL